MLIRPLTTAIAMKACQHADIASRNSEVRLSFDITGYAAAGDTHTLQLIDTSPVSDVTGFSVDSIQINDWIV